MGAVTPDAFSLFHRRMHVSALQLFREGHVAGQAYFTLGPGFQLELVLSIRLDGLRRQ